MHIIVLGLIGMLIISFIAMLFAHMHGIKTFVKGFPKLLQKLFGFWLIFVLISHLFLFFFRKNPFTPTFVNYFIAEIA